VALSNTSGAIVEGYIYDVFGKCTVITTAGTDGNWLTDDGASDTKSAYDNPYQFTGRRWDDETSLYYYRTRMYDPVIGRFLQPDPIGYDDGMNMYAYVGNNPVGCKYSSVLNTLSFRKLVLKISSVNDSSSYGSRKVQKYCGSFVANPVRKQFWIQSTNSSKPVYKPSCHKR